MARGRNPGTLVGGNGGPNSKVRSVRPKTEVDKLMNVGPQPKRKKPTKGQALVGQAVNGHFLPGNRIWETKSSWGERPIFASDKDLWNACVEYFEAVIANPLYHTEIKSHDGNHELVSVPKMRAMSIGALCVFLDVSRDCWSKWRKNNVEWADTIEKVEAVITAQKFEGGAAGMLNPSMISRDIGLVDKIEQSGQTTVVIQGPDADL
jgi:hypothetical protein